MMTEVFHALKNVLKGKAYGTTVGDEGGFAPKVTGGNAEALALIAEAVEKAGYTVGKDIVFALDVSGSIKRSNEARSLGSRTIRLFRPAPDRRIRPGLTGSLCYLVHPLGNSFS